MWKTIFIEGFPAKQTKRLTNIEITLDNKPISIIEYLRYCSNVAIGYVYEHKCQGSFGSLTYTKLQTKCN